MPRTLDIEAIEAIIPHRFPFRLIDRVADLKSGQSIIAFREVRSEEFYFRGHFPGNPIYPGVLQIESLAQAGAVAALSLQENKGKLALFAGIDNARFKRIVRPGDEMRLEVTMTKMRGSIGKAEARALVDGELACKADLTFAIKDQ